MSDQPMMHVSKMAIVWTLLWRSLTVLAVVFIVLGLATFFIPRDPFWDGKVSGIYWWHVWSVFRFMMVAFTASVLWIGIVVANLIEPSRPYEHHWFKQSANRLSVSVTGLLLGAVLVIAVLTLMGPVIRKHNHVDGLRTESNINMLANHEEPAINQGVLYSSGLFECDLLGLVCRRVYATKASLNRCIVALALDEGTGEILLMDSSGEVSYRYKQ